jgi:hypothetical protein
VPVIGTDDQLLRAIHHGGDERVGGAIFGGLAEGGSKMREGTAGCAHRLGRVRQPCSLEHQGHQLRERSFGE